MKTLDKQIINKPMYRMVIRRKDKIDLVLWFETIEQIKLFKKFIEDLIEGVRLKSKNK